PKVRAAAPALVAGRTMERGLPRTMVHASTRALRLAVRWVTEQEAVVLLAALGIVLSLTVFGKTAGEMQEGDLRDFDEGVLRMLRSPDNPSVPIRTDLARSGRDRRDRARRHDDSRAVPGHRGRLSGARRPLRRHRPRR